MFLLLGMNLGLILVHIYTSKYGQQSVTTEARTINLLVLAPNRHLVGSGQSAGRNLSCGVSLLRIPVAQWVWWQVCLLLAIRCQNQKVDGSSLSGDRLLPIFACVNMN